MRGILEWLGIYFESLMCARELYPEHDLFIPLMKLKNALRWIMGEDWITHLGTEYYDQVHQRPRTNRQTGNAIQASSAAERCKRPDRAAGASVFDRFRLELLEQVPEELVIDLMVELHLCALHDRTQQASTAVG